MKQILLYTNQTELNNTKRKATQGQKDLNSYIALIEQLTSLNLSKEDKIKIKINGLDYLENNLKFSLPNAPEKLKYESIGIDIEKIKRASTESWKYFEFKQDDKGNFELAEQQPLFEVHKRYATPRQLIVLEQSKTLADALNDASEKCLNVAHNYAGKSIKPLYKVKETFPVLSFNEKENKLIPNLEYIAHGIK